MVADIVALILLVVSFLRGLSRGFVKMISRTLIFVLALVLLYLGFTPAYQAVQEWKPYITLETTVSSNIKGYITDHMDKQYSSTTTAVDSLKFPQPITKFLTGYCDQINQVMQEDVTVTVTSAITELSMRVLVGFIFFLVLLILLYIVSHVLGIVTNLPVIHGANKLLGGVFGLINGFLFLYIVGFVILALPISSTVWLQQYLDGSLFKSFIYDHNVFTYFIKFIQK